MCWASSPSRQKVEYKQYSSNRSIVPLNLKNGATRTRRQGPGSCRGPLHPPTELMARGDHPLKFRRGVILPLPFEALLMHLEVGDVTPDLLTLRSHPIHRWRPVKFDHGARHYWFDANAFRKRLRILDELIQIGF